jgi:outer membrane protein TolC
VYLASAQAYSQAIDLESCLRKYKQNSEYAKQLKGYKKQNENDLKSIDAIYYPQLKLEAGASYQSDVFKPDIKLSLPVKFDFPSAPKDQYSASLSINQTIYDGGYASGATQTKALVLESNNLGVELNDRKMMENIADLYLNALILQENMKILENSKSALTIKLNNTKALEKNGVVLNSVVKQIEVEIIKIDQKIKQSEKDKNAILKTIAILSDADIKENSTVEEPKIPNNLTIDSRPLRPEEMIIDKKIEIMEAKKSEVVSQITPNVGAYLKGGAGNPNPFNMAKEGADFFYAFGVKMQWNVFDWNSNSRTRENLEIGKEIATYEKKAFAKAFDSQIEQLKNETDKSKETISYDMKILDLQKNITENAYAKFTGGAGTISDYLLEMNALTQANLNLNLHQIQLINSQIKIAIKNGLYNN